MINQGRAVGAMMSDVWPDGTAAYIERAEAWEAAFLAERVSR